MIKTKKVGRPKIADKDKKVQVIFYVKKRQVKDFCNEVAKIKLE